MTRIGWKFPPTGGGVEGGYNHAGMTHFQGARYPSLAREVIQNSLDARKSEARPVHVTFEIQQLLRDQMPGYEEFLDIINRCIEASDNDERARSELELEKKVVQRKKIIFLRIVDRETTGLSGSKWAALLKKEGLPDKESATAGGSFGIGKNAPFAMSPLRTVYYWSRFEAGSEVLEKFQGKAILISHLDDDKEDTQSIGFFGSKDKCLELSDAQIPEAIRMIETPDRGIGTSLWIPGFDGSAIWRDKIAGSVVENFFCAVDEAKLEVLVDSDSYTTTDLLSIEAASLGDWFEHLVNNEAHSEDNLRLRRARAFWEVMKAPMVIKEKEDKDLGHCKLWITVSDKYEDVGRVGLIRLNGMLITDQQEGLRQFRRTMPFAAVCRFESDKGNELLRGMENPRHDQFQPEFLPTEDRSRGRAALTRITRWIREEINKVAMPEVSGEAIAITELARLLPDLEPDDGLGAVPSEDGERPLEGAPLIQLKPIRPPRQRQEVPDDGVVEGGQEEGDDENGGTVGGGGGSDNGDGGGETGSGTETLVFGPVQIENSRCLPSPEDKKRLQVLFTPKSRGTGASLSLVEAGDSDFIQRNDLQVVKPNGERVKLSEFHLEFIANERVSILIEGDEPVAQRAWRIMVKQPKEHKPAAEGQK